MPSPDGDDYGNDGEDDGNDGNYGDDDGNDGGDDGPHPARNHKLRRAACDLLRRHHHLLKLPLADHNPENLKMINLFLRVRDKVGVCKKSDSFNDKDSFGDNEVETPK